MKLPDAIAIPLLAIPWIAAVAVLGWFVVQRFPPSGVFTVEAAMDGTNPFIHPFLPSERVSPPGAQEGGWTGQRILGDPVYASARVPGPYDRVRFDIEYRPVRQPLLEFGLARDPAGVDLDLRPMYFEELNTSAWIPVSGGYALAEGDTRVSEAEGAAHAVWDATTTMPLLSDETPRDGEPIKISLRGGHDFYLVPAAGEITLTLELQDANRKEGRTLVAFRVFRGDEEIEQKVVETNSSRETGMGNVFSQQIRIPSAPPGVYRVRFQADDDVFIRGIRTTSRRFVVGPRLSFGDTVGYATSPQPGIAWTNSRHIVAETFHAEGLQTITLGGERTELVRTHEPFRIDRQISRPTPVRLDAPQGDVRIVGDGWFAFEESAFFIPMPSRVTDGARLEDEGIRAVQTAYVRPANLGDGWYRSTFQFPLNGTEDRLRLVLSAPGIISRLGAVDIRKITATYERPRLTWDEWKSLLFRELKNAWQRL